MLNKFSIYFQKFSEKAALPSYPYWLAFFACADFFIFIIPFEALVFASLLAVRKRWLQFAIWSCLGSAVGAVLLAMSIQYFGTTQLEHWAPSFFNDPFVLKISKWLDQYSFWVIGGISLGPIAPQPTVIAAALAKTSLLSIGAGMMIGRFFKYLFYTVLIYFFKKDKDA